MEGVWKDTRQNVLMSDERRHDLGRRKILNLFGERTGKLKELVIKMILGGWKRFSGQGGKQQYEPSSGKKGKLRVVPMSTIGH